MKPPIIKKTLGSSPNLVRLIVNCLVLWRNKMHTSLVPFSSSSFSLGPGPFTWKPESPGPQLFEYTSIMFLLKLKALACVTSVESWAEEKMRIPSERNVWKISACLFQLVGGKLCTFYIKSITAWSKRRFCGPPQYMRKGHDPYLVIFPDFQTFPLRPYQSCYRRLWKVSREV